MKKKVAIPVSLLLVATVAAGVAGGIAAGISVFTGLLFLKTEMIIKTR